MLPEAAGPILAVSVFLGISHTNDQDLSVTLLHLPTGTSVPLFTNVGNSDDGFLVWILDSAATDMGVADNATVGAITGTFNPEGAEVLSEFAGEDGSGEWRLQITDGTAGRSSPGACGSPTSPVRQRGPARAECPARRSPAG
ncbi:MAG TPA: proprotein convertase P-domain-containing protein [Gaiellaceae bacterium]|nr:proprotein convertase P-domain-containing protein [Gaiellaceae bacterium]